MRPSSRRGRVPLLMAGVLAVAAGAAPAPATGSGAMRRAAFAAISVSESGSVESRRGALDSAFDAALRRASAVPPKGRVSRRRARFAPVPRDLRDSLTSYYMPKPRIPPATPSVSERLESAARAALRPWRSILEYAWAGSWSGLTQLTVVAQHRGS